MSGERRAGGEPSRECTGRKPAARLLSTPFSPPPRGCRTAQPRRWCPPARRAVRWHQAPSFDEAAQQRRRVDVRVATAQPRVQLARRSTHLGSLRHRRPRRQLGAGEPTVRGAQPVGVLDDDVQDAGDGAAKRHLPGGRSEAAVPAGTVYSRPRLPGAATWKPVRRKGVGHRCVDWRKQAARRQQWGEREDEQRHGHLQATQPNWGGVRSTMSRRQAAQAKRSGHASGGERARRWRTDFVWSWGTRLSLTPSTRLIWASVKPLVVVQGEDQFLPIRQLADLGAHEVTHLLLLDHRRGNDRHFATRPRSSAPASSARSNGPTVVDAIVESHWSSRGRSICSWSASSSSFRRTTPPTLIVGNRPAPLDFTPSERTERGAQSSSRVRRRSHPGCAAWRTSRT